MSHNKILGAAIAAALSVGGGTAQAAPSFGVAIGDTTEALCVVAMELFDNASADSTQALPSDSTFTTEYTLGLGTEDANKVKESFTVLYELTGGVWNSNPLATDFSLEGADGTPSISYQEVTETTVKYGVNAKDTNINGETKLVLNGFNVMVKKTDFASADAEVKLNITLSGGVDTSASLTLVKSGKGIYVSFVPNTEDVNIDVGTGGTTFTGGENAPNGASLGTMTISYPTTRLKAFDLTTDWDAKTSDDGVVTKATLKISNGPFAASRTDNRVFIDKSGDGCSLGKNGDDIAASVSSDGKTATFTDVKTLFPANTTDDTTVDTTTNKVCVLVPGKEAAINETADAPKALLTAKYTNRTTGSGVSYLEGNLLHIKKNGVICTVYLVTDGVTTSDNSNIRITNTSGNAGTLTGTLIDQDGKGVFANVELGKTTKLYETIYLDSAFLVAKAKAAGHSGEFGRGNLKISSDLLKMEVFALVRNRGSVMRPLLNMSLGASGNGCD